MVLGIYGAGGLGREVLELARIINGRKKNWEDFIFIIDGDGGNKVNDVMVYSYEDAISKFKGNLEISMGIGEPAVREKLFAKIKKDGIEAATLIHPDVYIPSTTTIGKGVIIQYGCFISCGVKISDYVYVQPMAGIGHDDVIGENCIISSYVSLAGNVHIGDETYVAPGTIVKHGISIGTFSVIGLGSIVHRDIPDNVIAMGNPARPMKNNDEKRVFGK